MSKGKKIILAVAVALLVIAAGVGLVVHRIRNDVRDAYASEWVADEIVEYMRTHDGRWPTNWDALRPIHDRYASQGRCPWAFAMLQDRVLVDWQADPAHLAAMPSASNGPPFQIVRLRSGRQMHWQDREPNRVIHEWLKNHADQANSPPPP